MNLSLLSLRFNKKGGQQSVKPREFRTTLFLWGLAALLVFLTGLLAVDGYLFYFVRTRADATNDIQNSSAVLSPREIDEVIEVLHRREQEFNAFLNSVSSTTVP